jgi:phosphoribosyl 1,2-cyclic phosphate phosphodiesterase
MGTATITILGCGGSGGTPLITNYWGNCDPNEPKNARTRPSLAIETDSTTVIIDTGADFRAQTIRENITKIDAVIYSHAHADHIMGMDDLRYAAIKRRIHGEEEFILPIYANEMTFIEMKKAFGYMFKTSDDGLYIPLIDETIFETGQNLSIGNLQLGTFKQIHGAGQSVGFRLGDIGYSTDISEMTEDGYETLKGINTWIVDCGQYGQATEELTVHPNLEKILKWNEIVQAEKLYLTHLTPRHDYNFINNATDCYIECAYDGLRLQTSL